MTQFFRHDKSTDRDLDEQDIALEEQLMVPVLDVPVWTPHYRPEQMKNFGQLTTAEQDLLLIFSVAAEKVDWLVKNAVIKNKQDRLFARELIAQRRLRKRLFRRWGLFTILIASLIATIVSVVINHFAKQILGP